MSNWTEHLLPDEFLFFASPAREAVGFRFLVPKK